MTNAPPHALRQIAQPRAQPEDVHRAGAGAELAQPAGDRCSGAGPGDASRLQQRLAPARAGRRGPPSACSPSRARRRRDGARPRSRRPPPAAGDRAGRRRSSRCPPVSTTAPGPSASTARASCSASPGARCSRSRRPRQQRPRLRHVRRQHARARQDLLDQRSARAPGSSRRAPDSATITGSTTTGMPGGSSSSAAATAERVSSVAEHPDLDGVHADVRSDRPDLREHHLRGHAWIAVTPTCSAR